MSSFSSGRAWWASSTRNARATAIGAIALTTGLAVACAAVWVSPEISPVTRAGELYQAVTGQDTREQQLQAQVGELTAQLEAARLDLDASGADSVRAESLIDDLQQQIWSLEGRIEADAKGDADREAALGAGGSGSGGSGSGGEGGSGGGGASGDGTATISAPPRSALVAPSKDLFGMYTQQSPYNWAELDATARRIGSEPGIAGYFGGWDGDFRADAVTRSWQRGMLPLLTWESRPLEAANDVVDEPAYRLQKIIDGDFDAYLTRYAKAIRKTGLPLAIRLNHEMNGDWYPWSEQVNGNSPGEYAEMWRHVHDIFEKAGANDYVIWVWAPNRIDKLAASARSLEYLRSLYPGDEYVDWVGMSGYLRPPYAEGTQFTFEETFSKTLAQLRQVARKPVFLAEIGASEIGGGKPHWIRSLFKNLALPENQDVIGFSWFNLTVTSSVQGSLATNDWRITSRADSLAAFKEGLLASGSGFERRAPR
ncbi:glycosyl hydrolase [Homoserinibacter sp. YIM 151385]|uniref:glycosyl hydrolase n=1 Tax=Homoserinibacter sp. YIM 151385 TaxID=2985506 RepID=UPI0022F0FE56|nr:glycosyl hydrolase [Homoserinibacter sp. YIM 151385]WBU38476.1 glycosyl hydrolase [Homoserinibacter sp. YIM 151385]